MRSTGILSAQQTWTRQDGLLDELPGLRQAGRVAARVGRSAWRSTRPAHALAKEVRKHRRTWLPAPGDGASVTPGTEVVRDVELPHEPASADAPRPPVEPRPARAGLDPGRPAAQTARISGTVVDPAGNVVQNPDITVATRPTWQPETSMRYVFVDQAGERRSESRRHNQREQERMGALDRPRRPRPTSSSQIYRCIHAPTGPRIRQCGAMLPSMRMLSVALVIGSVYGCGGSLTKPRVQRRPT